MSLYRYTFGNSQDQYYYTRRIRGSYYKTTLLILDKYIHGRLVHYWVLAKNTFTQIGNYYNAAMTWS